VAICVLIVLVGLGLGGLNRLNQSYAIQSCKNNLHNLYGALQDYASNHDGRFPIADGAPAGSFVQVLAQNGVLDPKASASCPAVRVVATSNEAIDYAY